MNGKLSDGKIDVVCEVCGKTVTVKRSRALQSKHHYCSRECYYRNQFRRDTFACEYCGKPFTRAKGISNERRRSGLPLPRFCSVACKNKALISKVTRSCQTCGKEFETFPVEVRKGGGKFCSADCFKVYQRTSGEFFRLLRKKASCKPNGAENALLAMFPDDLRFVGDGDLWLVLADGRHRNPDFKVTDQKKIIEVFGSPFHKPPEEAQAISDYAAIGWKCLVVWANSLRSERRRAILRPIVAKFIRS